MIPRDNRTNKQRSIARTTFEGRRQESFTDGQGTPCDAVVCCLCQPGLLILGEGGGNETTCQCVDWRLGGNVGKGWRG